MTQEDKLLLLKDLYARLLYRVIVTTTNSSVKFGVVSGISIESKISVRTKHADIVFDCTEVKPYLRSISSMTEEEKEEYRKVCELDTEILANHPMNGEPFPALYNSLDWLNANHFDYRGLIEKGLAIEITSENNPYK